VEQKRREQGEVEFISAGSSLKLCLVAEGRADIYPRTGPTMEWDTAAGQAVVECSGGKVYKYDTEEPLGYNKENLLNPWFVAAR
jgi:3'(2'), 5'-bisphosphate nucleotidase